MIKIPRKSSGMRVTKQAGRACEWEIIDGIMIGTLDDRNITTLIDWGQAIAPLMFAEAMLAQAFARRIDAGQMET